MSSPWLRKIATVVAVLLAANLVVTAIASGLPAPVVYPTREIQLGVDRLERATANGCLDLLVTGNSVAAAALSADRLADRVGLDGGIVSVLPGSIASVDVDWMNRVTLPAARPGTLVYVASPVMFFPEDSARSYGLGIYRRSIAIRGGWPGDFQRWAVQHVPLIRHRATLADTETLVKLFRGQIETDLVTSAPGFTFEPDGHVNSTAIWDGSGERLAVIRSAFAAVGDDWRVDREQADVLRDQFARLVNQGVDVVFLIPPVTDDLPALFPDGAAGFDVYLETARQVAEGSGAITVDLSARAYPDELFYDTHHLNEAGSRRLTDELVSALGDEPLQACG